MIYVLSTSYCLTHPIFRSVCLSSAKQGCFSEGLESGSLGWIKQIRLKLSMNCDAGTSDFTLCWTRKVAFLAWAESLTQRCAKGKGWLPEVSWVGRRFLKHFSLQRSQKALAGKFGVALPGPHLFCFTTASTSCAGSLGLEGCHPQKHAEVCLETVFWWCFVSCNKNSRNEMFCLIDRATLKRHCKVGINLHLLMLPGRRCQVASANGALWSLTNSLFRSSESDESKPVGTKDDKKTIANKSPRWRETDQHELEAGDTWRGPSILLLMDDGDDHDD